MIANQTKYGQIKVVSFTIYKGKPWLQDNYIEILSTYNEEKFVVTERSIGTLKSKINKYMSVISKNVYIDKLDDYLMNKTIHIIAQSK